MKLKKRNQKKKTVTRKKNEEPEENGRNGKRGRVKTTSDPNKETVLETTVNVFRCFAARGVWFFFFCIFISITNMIVRGRKG